MKTIYTEKAPKPVGPYSQAVKSNGFLFVSGQLGVDVHGTTKDTIEGQTEQCILNIRHILEQEGLSLEKVVKATVYLADMNDFQKMNSVYEKYFTGKPARAAVGVALLKNFKVEIEVVASFE
jgi:2-iminobutanoate/2-iminopropanoate deaminase